jgi:adenosyl cobinamide kinase/adenosyl cobinamide phosphate guanylyltransferase
MPLTVLLGGARSGKSRLAVELALAAGGPVSYIATAEPLDEEMAERIALHRAERPGSWETLEEPCALADTVSSVGTDRVLVIDCLSLWVANLLERGQDRGEILTHCGRAAAAAARESATIVVSNEVGLGIVPSTPRGREYRDLLGSVNREWVERADFAALVVAGRALPLVDVRSVVEPQLEPAP